VRDFLDGIRLPVRPVVCRVDAPCIARAVVRGAQDPVHDRVTHIDIGR